MPTHDIHETLDEMILGESYPEVHDFVDSTVKTSGPHHRDDPIHSLEAVVTFAALNQNPEYLDAGMMHMVADDFFTPEMEEMFKMIEWFENYG